MPKLSVVISAYNEEQIITRCLDSVSFADEIIFIDNSSTDKTVKIAGKYTNKIFIKENNLMLNVNKNFGFTKATGDWILNIDADEQVTPELAKEIQEKITSQTSPIGYWIPRKNIIFNKWIQNSIWWPDYQLRLFKREKGKFPEKHVHEMIIVEGNTEKLQNPLMHQNYSSLSQYLYKLDKIYTENEVKNFLDSGKKIIWIDALRFPADDFLKTFFAQKGYKDGLHGLVLSLLQAFYAEIVFAKIWEKQGFKEHNNKDFLQDVYKESKKIAHEFRYWFLTAFLNETNNVWKKGLYRILRKNHSKKFL